MADNLDPEIQQQLNEQMQRMTETVSSMVPAMVLMTAAMSNYIAESKGLSGVQKDGKKVVEDFLKAQKDATAAAEAEAKAAKELEKAMNQLNKSYDKAMEGLGQFSIALLTAGGGMDKYSSAVGSAGDAAWEAGKAFGPLGMVIGGIVKAFSFMAAAVFKQNDNMLKASDSLAQMGVTGGISSKEIMTLGQRAGYSSNQLEDWTNLVKGIGTDITALGLSATEGTKAFGKLTEMDEQVLEGYRNLGVSQVALNKNQADYVKLQVRSGQEIDKRSLQDGSLRRASLEYTNNLLELSAFTGMEVEEIKKKQEVARADLAISTRLALLQDKEAALRERAAATGDKDLAAQADKIAKERKNTMALQDMAVALGMSGDEMAGFNSMLATGNFNDLSAGFAAGTPDILEFMKNVKEGKREPYELAKYMADATKKTRENVGEAIIQQKDIGKSFAYSKEMVELEAKMRGKTPEQIDKMMAEEKEKRDKALKGEITDDAKKARNAQETAERRARLGADAIVGVLNGPVTKAFEYLMKVMGALAKGIAHFAKWLGGPDFTEMFDTPEEIAVKAKANATALAETTKKIEDTKKLMTDSSAVKEELVKKKQLAEDSYITKAQETEKIRELYSKEGDEKKKAILKDQLIEASKEEFAAKQLADTAALNIKNTRFSMTKEEGERRVMELEKQKLALLEKGKTLSERQTTLSAGTTPPTPDSKAGNASSASSASSPISSAIGPISSADQLKAAGLTIKKGDVQTEGSYIDPKLIEAAKLVQASVPGFMQFTGFNDQYHTENSPTSKHTQGMAFDFVLNKKPSKEDGAKIVSMLSELGLQGIDEYNAPSAKATGGHIHGGLKAYDGGIFNGPIGGYNVELHGREAIVPLPSPNELVKEGSKEAALPGNASANTENSNGIIAALMAMMEEKFDDMIDVLQEGNDTSEELLKVARV